MEIIFATSSCCVKRTQHTYAHEHWTPCTSHIQPNTCRKNWEIFGSLAKAHDDALTDFPPHCRRRFILQRKCRNNMQLERANVYVVSNDAFSVPTKTTRNTERLRKLCVNTSTCPQRVSVYLRHVPTQVRKMNILLECWMDAYLFVMCGMLIRISAKHSAKHFEHKTRNTQLRVRLNEWIMNDDLASVKLRHQTLNNIEFIMKSLTLPILGSCLSVINGISTMK